MKCAFRNNAFRISIYKSFSIFKNYFKSYSKNYSNYYYYFSIIILLTLFRMGRGQLQPPFGFLFVIFFFCKSYNLEFFKFYYYALRRFSANFQGYIASSGQTLFQTAWKKVPKKAKKTQNLSKSGSDKKELIKLPIFFFVQKFHTILVWKPEKFQANSFYGSWEITRRSVSDLHLTLAPPSHTYTEAIRSRVKLFFYYFIQNFEILLKRVSEF